MIRNITNISNSALVLSDLSGQMLEPSEVFDGLCYGETALRASASVQVGLLTGTLKVNDGFTDFLGQEAVALIQGFATQVTKDGKQIFTSSDRPMGYYRHFTGAGDDVTSNPKVIGAGPSIHLVAEAGQTSTLDIHFVDDVYVRDGEVWFLNAGFDSHLGIDVICPANVPFPSPTKTGTLDLTATGFVPNTNGSGAFMTAPVEVKLFRFLNRFHLVGSEGRGSVQSPEPFLLNYPYFLRYSIQADADLTAPLKAAITMGMFRKKTV